MNQSELFEVIKASPEQVWEVLFGQYGDIHVHNPGMQASSYMNGGSRGELNSVRHCEFNDKLYVDEEIAEVDETNYSVRIVVLEHNLPFMKEMAATYELSALDDDKTQVKMVSFNSFSPGFMKYLMQARLKKLLARHLFGMKYYIETGKAVDADGYSKVFRGYEQAS